MYQRDRGWGHAGDAGGMSEGARTDFDQRFLYFAGKSADRAVVEPLRNGALLGFFKPVDGALLLQKIAGVFDFGFD